MKYILLLILPLFGFSQDDYYTSLQKRSKEEQIEEITKQIQVSESLDLHNVFIGLKDVGISLLPYNSVLIERSKKSEWPNELHIILKVLIEQGTDKLVLEKMLNSSKGVWDKGNWSQTFWDLIRDNGFSIDEGPYYTVNDNGEKAYNIKLYVGEKIKNNELGENPILAINYKLTNYDTGALFDLLKALDIADIQITPKDKATGLFGKRGIDGKIDITTRKYLNYQIKLE